MDDRSNVSRALSALFIFVFLRFWAGMSKANWMDQVVDTVVGLGFESVEVAFVSGGLLRVTIDVLDGSRAIQVDDCELISKQLSHLLYVLEVEYDRMEVSSPGLDRLLTKPEHIVRFQGMRVVLSLKDPIVQFKQRKQFTGVLLSKSELSADRFAILFTTDSQEEFEIIVAWCEVKELRLASEVPFTSKRSKGNCK